MTEEKRDSPRIPVHEQVTGEVTVFQPVTILDMSERGAQLETTFPMQLEGLHDFRLSLGSRSVVVKGRIVHCQIGELREGVVIYRTGIEFIQPSPHVQLAIEAFVEAQRAIRAALPVVDAELADDGV